jgi:uncharacterized membrane protein
MPECEKCKVPLVLADDHYWAAFQETFWKCPECKQTFATYRTKQVSPLKSVILGLFRIAEHNREHYVTINLFGENVYACSRCLGAYATGLICYFLFGFLYLLNISLPFYPVFITSFALGSVTLIDFATVDIFHVRKGNNRIRFFAGYLLGIAAMLYFWLLPASWYFRIGTLLIYNLLAILVAFVSLRMRKTDDGEAQVSPG